MNPQEFFIRESLALARSLDIPSARLYLQGLLAMIGECDEAHAIRNAVVLLDESDRQLELLAQTKSN